MPQYYLRNNLFTEAYILTLDDNLDSIESVKVLVATHNKETGEWKRVPAFDYSSYERLYGSYVRYRNIGFIGRFLSTSGMIFFVNDCKFLLFDPLLHIQVTLGEGLCRCIISYSGEVQFDFEFYPNEEHSWDPWTDREDDFLIYMSERLNDPERRKAYQESLEGDAAAIEEEGAVIPNISF